LDLKLRFSGLIALILLALLWSISPALAEDASRVSASLGADDSASTIAAADDLAPAVPMNVQGIWRFSVTGEEVTVALNQSGDSIFGQAKFEGANPWNGVVSGLVSDRMVYIAMAAMQGKVMVSTYVTGTAGDNSITGSYVRYDGSGSATMGDLSASKISSDTSGYTPASLALPATAAPCQTTPEPPAAASKRSAFKDVTELAKGIDPNIMPRFAQL
jgi:hypothetical protein